MIDLVGLTTAVTAFHVVAASPGPATLAVATVSMSAGRQQGLVFGAGLSLGLAFWGVIAATGLGAILQTSAAVLFVLKFLGGAYLLWLAYRSVLSTKETIAPAAKPVRKGKWFTRGLLLNLSNPKAVLAWMATLALGVGNGSSLLQVTVATSLCIILGFVIYATYSMVFSTASTMNIYVRLRRWVDAAVAGLFSVAGVGLIKSAFTRS